MQITAHYNRFSFVLLQELITNVALLQNTEQALHSNFLA